MITKLGRRATKSNSDVRHSIKIRKAQSNDIPEIYRILSEAFEPYRHYYTERAYNATVISPREIEDRIHEQETNVLVAIYEGAIAGTVSITVENNEGVHIRSMAVTPCHWGKGIGWCMIEKIEIIARKKQCRTLFLESFNPLIKAEKLYKKFGFRETMKKRMYHGISIFEMVKEIKKKKRKQYYELKEDPIFY